MDVPAYRVLWLMAIAALAGCVYPTGGRKSCCLPCPPGYIAAEADLLERGAILADAPRVSGDLAIHAYPQPPEESYRLLTPCECQCDAVARATTAYLVDIERQLAIASIPPRPQSRMARGLRVHRRLLELRAAQIRNDASGQALEAYYQLAAAEASMEVVIRSHAHVRRLLGYVHELQAQGMQAVLDVTDLKGQEAELLSQKAELEWTIAQLNGRLRLLIGWDLASEARIWPETDLVVIQEPLDLHCAVQTGLGARPDLMTLRLLSATLDEATLPLVRGALQTQDATLGNVTSGSERLSQLLRPARGDDELRARRAQLNALLVEKERELTVAIHAAAGAVAMRRDQAILVRHRLEIAQKRLRELQQLRAVGQIPPLDVFSQEGMLLEIEADLVRSAAAWRLAEVQFRQTLGVLAWECLTHNRPCMLQDRGDAVVEGPLPLPADLQEALPAADEASLDLDYAPMSEPPLPPLVRQAKPSKGKPATLFQFLSRSEPAPLDASDR